MIHEMMHAAVLVSAGERIAFGMADIALAIACFSCDPSGISLSVAIAPYIFDIVFVVAGLVASSRTFYWISNIAYFDIMSNFFGFLIGRLPNDFDIMTKTGYSEAALIISAATLVWLYVNRRNLKNWRRLKKKYL